MAYTPEQVRAATKAHGTIFFTHDLQPVVPQEGQWFCEFHICPIDQYTAEEVRDEAIVEFLGTTDSAFLQDGQWVHFPDHRVAGDQDESDRRPYGDILVLQH